MQNASKMLLYQQSPSRGNPKKRENAAMPQRSPWEDEKKITTTKLLRASIIAILCTTWPRCRVPWPAHVNFDEFKRFLVAKNGYYGATSRTTGRQVSLRDNKFQDNFRTTRSVIEIIGDSQGHLQAQCISVRTLRTTQKHIGELFIALHYEYSSR